MEENSIIYDGHIHMSINKPLDAKKFLSDSSRSGIGGGLVLSQPPIGLPDARGIDIPAYFYRTGFAFRKIGV